MGHPIIRPKPNFGRICIYAPRIYPMFFPEPGVKTAGGAENQQKIIIEQLAKNGFDITVICHARRFDTTVDIAPGIRLVTLPDTASRGVPGLRFIYPNMSDAASALIAAKPHLIYQRGAGVATAAARFAADRLKIPFIYASASDAEFPIDRKNLLGDRRSSAAFRWGIKGAQNILVQNLHQLGHADFSLSRRTTLMPNMVDFSRFQMKPFSNDQVGAILWVGSLQRAKRPELFIRIVKQCPNQKFHMICSSTGNQHVETEFKSVMHEASHLKNLTITQYVRPADMARHYAQSSLLVNTSNIEGFPNTFLEAWASGLPVVSFVDPKLTSESMPQILAHSEASMIELIQSLWQSPAVRATLGTAARQYALKNHACEILIPRYVSLMSGLIEQSRVFST
jgi:glycosyltransferase involved in cell wall biosynthesis